MNTALQRMSEAKYCDDIFLFQKTLKKLRDIDDKIIYALNLSTPTKSFQARGVDPGERCSTLQEELRESHQARGRLLTSCLDNVRDEVWSRRSSLRTSSKRERTKHSKRSAQNSSDRMDGRRGRFSLGLRNHNQ